MKKSIYNKILIIFFILFVIIYSFSCINYAVTNGKDSFNKLTMDITIDEEGNAFITEEWNISIYSGTELYKTYYDMDNSVVSDLKVSEDGEEFKTQATWDINASMSSKKNKCGINIVSEGYELCFGIGDYGTHTYTLEYKISNFIFNDNTTDFYLVSSNMDPTPKEVDIVINSENKIFKDDVDVTFSGLKGTTKVDDGMIVFNSTSQMTASDYVRCTLDTGSDVTQNEEDSSSSNTQVVTKEDSSNKVTKTKSENKIGNVICVILIFLVLALVIRKYRLNKAEKDNNN